MKILHLINLQGFGGAERLFIEYLKNSSFTNEVLCTSNQINNNIISELKPYKIIYANRIGNTSVKYPAFLRKYILSKKINQQHSDITLVWDFVPKIDKKPANTTFLYYDHGCSWRYPENKKTLTFLGMLDGAISVSVASKRIMQLRFNPEFKISTVINRLPMKTAFCSHTPPEKKIILGTASRLVGLKGIGVSILCLKMLIESGKDAELIIAGDGEKKNKLEELAAKLNIADKVRFTGYQHNMEDFYSSIDIYLSTPVTEPFGLSCIEALSQGIPVIFPMIDGQPEAVKDKYCGIGIKPSLSAEEYRELTGLSVDFPYDIYDPVNDCLADIKLISPSDIIPAITEIISDYNSYSENAKKWSLKTTDYDAFICEFESILEEMKYR
ncbi:glycosyl transferase [Morganella morganii]|uniref:Glycosyl transferase n=1 Tax=Morganella morganii TaxID=582 RepID=A0A433ZU08_MORMO|nr:glycosyltransferase [Morganella morganii]RUT65600.1 glycosyl transferase [Morganella morganii]